MKPLANETRPRGDLVPIRVSWTKEECTRAGIFRLVIHIGNLAVGLVLNVLIYSAAIVLGRLAWRRAVVFRRRRKDLCVNCGYPIEPAVATCPECGNLTGGDA